MAARKSEFQDGSVVRITSESAVVLTRLAADTGNNVRSTEIAQQSGLAYYELRSDAKTTYTVTADGKSITPAANTTFRVDLTAKTPEVSVLAGQIHVTGPENSFMADVHEGQAIAFPKVGNAQYTIANGVLPNGFDEWNDQLDQEARQQAQQQTAAREQGNGENTGMGWGDLDSYGGWYPLPGYGMVWQPYGVGSDFDPYGEGMWSYYGPGFGYTWVSAYPWGWLPFHCGGWSYIGGFGWGWMPGPYGCGGGFMGAGFGWYGGGWYGRHPYVRIYNPRANYHPTLPPHIVRGQVPPRSIRVGTGPMMGRAAIKPGNPSHIARFNGQKIAPLNSVMTGVHVPVRNAALYNNYPAHLPQSSVRGSLLRGAGGTGTTSAHPGMTSGLRGNLHTPVGTQQGRFFPGAFRSPMNANRMQTLNPAQNRVQGHNFLQRSGGMRPQPVFRTQPANFGRPMSSPMHFSGSGMSPGVHPGGSPGFRGGSPAFRSAPASSFHGGGFSGGRAGGMSSGGFHGGGMSGGGGHTGR